MYVQLTAVKWFYYFKVELTIDKKWNSFKFDLIFILKFTKKVTDIFIIDNKNKITEYICSIKKYQIKSIHYVRNRYRIEFTRLSKKL